MQNHFDTKKYAVLNGVLGFFAKLSLRLLSARVQPDGRDQGADHTDGVRRAVAWVHEAVLYRLVVKIKMEC